MHGSQSSTQGQRIKSPNNRHARLSVNYSNHECQEAITILRKAGFEITSSPVSELVVPVLTLGSNTYYGISEIRQAVLSETGILPNSERSSQTITQKGKK